MAYLLQLTRRGYTTSSILTHLFLVLSSILADRITIDTAILIEYPEASSSHLDTS
jgi:hypothetical protein